MPRCRRSNSRRARACGCSVSSSSSHDICLAPAQDPRDLEPVVEDDDVGERARLEKTDVAASEEPRRHLGRRADGLLEGDPERVEVPHKTGLLPIQAQGSRELPTASARDAPGRL